MPPVVRDLAASDADLARRVLLESPAPQAEAELCARFAPRLRSYGLRHLRDADAADDLVQRVLVLTVEKLRAGQVREPERIASFILGTARLTVQSMHRHRGRSEPLTDDHPALTSLSEPAREPLDLQRVASGLEHLAERERTVIVLSFFQDATATEIAGVLGLEPGYVRVIRHRALGRLRAWLEPERESLHEPL